MVIRNVRPDIVTFSVPFARLGHIHMGGRGTLVKLSTGTLAVFSPVALTEATKAKVAEMGGKVGYIVALDYVHHIFISEWSKEYPDAKIIGVEGLREKRVKDSDPMIGNEEFEMEFTKANKRELSISDEFDADFEYEYAEGHVNHELVFFHKKNQALIEADLIMNLPPNEQYSKVPEKDRNFNDLWDKLFNLIVGGSGDNKWGKRLHWYLLAKDKASLNDSLQRMDKWDFKLLIPCHGDVIEDTGKEFFRKMFEWHLQTDQK